MRVLLPLLLASVSCATARPVEPSAAAPTAPSPAGDGCVVGPRILSSTTINSGKPVVASRGDEFAVVWEEAGESRAELRLQLFDGHGAPLTGSLLVAALVSGGGNPRITATDEGYAVVWSVEREATTAIVMQRFDRRGRPLGAPTEALTSPTARPLALTPTRDGFVLVWWQWAMTPHLQVASWLDRRGQRVSDVELTRLSSEDPTADVRTQPDGSLLVAWEQEVDSQPQVLVGALQTHEVVKQGAPYPGRNPALLRDGVVMTGVDGATVGYAPFGASSATPLVAGRLADGAVLGNDSVLCRAQQGSDASGGATDELLCARAKSSELLHERSLARSSRLLGTAQLADTSFGYVVAMAINPANPEAGAVQLTSVI